MEIQMSRYKSASAYVWAHAIENPYVVRGLVGNVSGELIGSFKRLDAAICASFGFEDVTIHHAVSNRLEYSRINKQ